MWKTCRIFGIRGKGVKGVLGLYLGNYGLSRSEAKGMFGCVASIFFPI